MRFYQQSTLVTDQHFLLVASLFCLKSIHSCHLISSKNAVWCGQTPTTSKGYRWKVYQMDQRDIRHEISAGFRFPLELC